MCVCVCGMCGVCVCVCEGEMRVGGVVCNMDCERGKKTHPNPVGQRKHHHR